MPSLAAQLAALPEPERLAMLAKYSNDDLRALKHNWRFWARPEQLAPGTEGAAESRTDWRTWLYLAGRGAGKTRSGAEWVRERVATGSRYIIMAAPTSADVRDVQVEGESGILSIYPHGEAPTYEPSKRRLTWKNGATAVLLSAEEPERFRGIQGDTVWCFIAGTMIATPLGDVPIERLRVGDWVITRDGPRRVVADGSHRATVGTVTFSNGAELTGTGDHPVLTPCGWMSMSNLCESQTVLGGECTAMGTSPDTSAVRSSTSTDGSGSGITGQSLTDTKSITATDARQTTPSKTSKSSPPATTTIATSPCGPSSTAFASTAGGHSSADASPVLCDASRAITDGPMGSEPPSARARSAAGVSGPSAVPFAVSVASTWAPVGEATVYNIAVEGMPEYVANGIIVHNCDELCAWERPEAWTLLQFAMRLGAPRFMVTTTPKNTPVLADLLRDPRTVISRGSTFDNAMNLAPEFIDAIRDKYEGTRLGRQELYAEVLLDTPGALWNTAMLEACRVSAVPPLQRVVTALDPSVTAHEGSDEAGIIVAGVGMCRCKGASERHLFVLGDYSGKFTPDGWAKATVAAHRKHNGDRVVAEKNQGGDMIEGALRTVDPHLPYRGISARVGKRVRAEPVAALYEQNKVHHVGELHKLEAEQCSWDPLNPSAKSPNRIDALVHAATDLMLGGGVPTFSFAPGGLSMSRNREDD